MAKVNHADFPGGSGLAAALALDALRIDGVDASLPHERRFAGGVAAAHVTRARRQLPRRPAAVRAAGPLLPLPRPARAVQGHAVQIVSTVQVGTIQLPAHVEQGVVEEAEAWRGPCGRRGQLGHQAGQGLGSRGLLLCLLFHLTRENQVALRGPAQNFLQLRRDRLALKGRAHSNHFIEGR